MEKRSRNTLIIIIIIIIIIITTLPRWGRASHVSMTQRAVPPWDLPPAGATQDGKVKG